MKTHNWKQIETEVSKAFRVKYEEYVAQQDDKSSALEDARLDAAELIPTGVTGAFDDSTLTFTCDFENDAE